jgi:hypothetical protein
MKMEEPEATANCPGIELGQFLGLGEPKRILLTGFPKSGAMWVKGVIDAFLPYYFWLEHPVSNLLKYFLFSYILYYISITVC